MRKKHRERKQNSICKMDLILELIGLRSSMMLMNYLYKSHNDIIILIHKTNLFDRFSDACMTLQNEEERHIME